MLRILFAQNADVLLLYRVVDVRSYIKYAHFYDLNFIAFEDGFITGFKAPEVHAMNKASIDYESIVAGRRRGILFGDQVEDTLAAINSDVTKIGFYDPNSHSLNTLKKEFDIILTDESSFINVGHILIKGYKK